MLFCLFKKVILSSLKIPRYTQVAQHLILYALANSTPLSPTLIGEFSNVSITAKSGAEIWVDGEHKVEVRSEGKDPMAQTVIIREGALSSVAGELKSVTGELKEETPKNQDELVFNVNGIQFTMKRVEGGTFTMGATSEQGSDAYSDEKPAHKVTLDDYYIGVTEVTQELWQAVMGKNPSYFTGNSNLPVENVSWDDCQEFIRKLNQLTGQTFSLPTEAQWEFAARGGNLSKGYKYSGSNNIGDVAWYDNNSNDKTHPVAQKQPNELGLYDMSGNVWEWCQDWYGSYYSFFQNNPEGPSSGSYRVDRGGGWSNDARSCRVSNRGRCSSVYRNNFLGLRLALVSSH